MTDHTRRTFLHASCVGLPALVAGCVGDSSDDAGTDGSDERSGDGTGADDGSDDNGEGHGDDDDGAGSADDKSSVVGTETFPLSAESSQPWWYRYDRDALGAVYLHGSEESLQDGPRVDLSEEQQEELATFVEETDFDTELLLQVGSAGPSTCYNRIDVSDVAVEDGTLLGTASVKDTSDDDVCGSAVTYPWTLVRVTVEGPLPDSARLSITDGWGDEGDVEGPKERRLDPAELGGHVQPDGDPPDTPPALACEDDEFERHGQWVDEEDISLGEASDDDGPVFALRVDHQQFERGETAHIRLTNLTDREQMTGNRSKFNLQVNTEAGWQDVRGFSDGKTLPYTDEGVTHPPGHGFEWEVELTEDGIASEGMHGDVLEVCPDLPTGRYRFLFWEVDIAVEFDLVE